ncbi:protein-disulfide reductase DsbD N-terminal domain-containing protein [Pedobacter sp. MC2016-24]|uniref:protein-disulfide reductase DsbD N-terminal domain-containing protein n=1 Tax=Pedobacter sp. MC2016-24 TaxID=2780090 RepID=UPI0018815CAA|nr:protein-disulfide reductase DsbD N-terminal domain-containing protein [Pedobacter sp. MC2016-24]MBE9598458.1 protein-disulfide reductase DsbD N-terminal domain-containing protein [Pedobacter sp. MC2016-24]
MKKQLITLLVLPLLWTIHAKAQILKPVKWSYAAKKTSDTEATILLKAEIEDSWHIYSAYQKDGGPLKTSFKFSPSKAYILVGKITEPKPLSVFDKNFGIQVDYFEKTVTFQQKIKLKAKQTTVKGKLEFMACTKSQCLPPDEVNFSIPIN